MISLCASIAIGIGVLIVAIAWVKYYGRYNYNFHMAEAHRYYQAALYWKSVADGFFQDNDEKRKKAMELYFSIMATVENHRAAAEATIEEVRDYNG